MGRRSMARQLVAAVLAAAGALAANTEAECSLNGELQGGSCVCDPGWHGPVCANLAVAPSRVLWPQLSDGDPRTIDAPSLSWGGSLLQDSSGAWHGWFNGE